MKTEDQIFEEAAKLLAQLLKFAEPSTKEEAVTVMGLAGRVLVEAMSENFDIQVKIEAVSGIRARGEI